MSIDPTPALISRCKAWIQVTDTLKQYLIAAAQRYDWISDATAKISREMPEPNDLGAQFAPLGAGGIKDLFSRLWWDLNLPDGKCASDASTVIKSKLLVDLELLRKDLERSIEDFVEMSDAPTSNLSPVTSKDPKLEQSIQRFQQAVSDAESGKQPQEDPVVLKMALDKQIDASLRKHSLSSASSDNYHVQDVAKRLDGTVVERLQTVLKQYTDMAEGNGKIIANGARNVSQVFVHEPKLIEYKYWLQSKEAPQAFRGSARSGAFKEVDFPKEDSKFAKPIRTGTLERRSRILKTYAASEYVLTPLSLIEMRHNQPVWSIDLLDAELVDQHKAITDNQFVIRARQHGSKSGNKHNWVFRAKVVANWRRDLTALLSGSKPESVASFYEVSSPLPGKQIPLQPSKSVLDSDSDVSDIEEEAKN